MLIKAVPLDIAGRYYTLASLAYVGSALVFIGADLYLQKEVINDRASEALNLAALIPLIGKIMLIGASISAVFVAINGIFTSSHFHDWSINALACGILSAGMFFASVFRNISLGKGLINVGIGASALEQLGRFLLIMICIASFRSLDTGSNAMIVASGLGSVLAGFATIFLIKRSSTIKSDACYHFPSWIDVKLRFIPVSLGALLNLVQLQGYRVIVGDWFGDQVAVGQVATLTVLGLSGAASVLGLFTQLWLRKIYHGGGASNFAIIKKGALLVLILTVASVPVGYVFLHVINKSNLVTYLYLIPIGVLVEGGNFLLGIIGYQVNANSNSLWLTIWAGVVGVIITYLILTVGLMTGGNIIGTIAISLLLGQVATVIYAVRKVMSIYTDSLSVV